MLAKQAKQAEKLKVLVDPKIKMLSAEKSSVTVGWPLCLYCGSFLEPLKEILDSHPEKKLHKQIYEKDIIYHPPAEISTVFNHC